MRRLPRVMAALALTVVSLVTPALPAHADACAASLPHPDGHGITCVRVDRRPQPDRSELRDITMTSTAIFQPAGGTPEISPLAREITVRIYLPPGYEPGGATRYRTLYLLNGGGDNYDEWTTKADLVSLIASVPGRPFDGIVVMPTGGMTGWYADWAGRTDGYFAPKWETYHISQLIPWIDANFPTIADRSGRGLAGVSMGGYGTLRYAAAHPGVFSVIGAFSPGIDLRAKPAQRTVSDSMWQSGAAITLADLGKFRVNKYEGGVIVIDQHEQLLYRLDTLFGPHTTATGPDGRTVYDWPSANPAVLATQGAYAPFDGRIGLYAGGCETLPRDSSGGYVLGDGDDPAPPECGYSTTSPENTEAPAVNEAILGSHAGAFHTSLTGLGVRHRYCYGTGGHDWNAWPGVLADFLQYAYGTAPARCPNA